MTGEPLEGGARTAVNYKKSSPGNPLVSVISVALNNRKGLEATMESVFNQKYSNIEYIIIDGGSTDGSLELIQQFDERLDYWSSGPDEGIYDAMNRGIEKAGGEWTIFMNAGDVFYSHDTVRNVVRKIDPGSDLVYGSFLYVQPEYGNLTTLKKPGKLAELWLGMVFSHQALFVRTSILKRKCFDCRYRYSADYAMVFGLEKQGYKFQKVDDIIAKVSAGGESDVNRLERRREQICIARKYGSNFSREGYFFCVVCAVKASALFKRVLPDDFIRAIYRIRHRRSKYPVTGTRAGGTSEK